MEIAGGKRESIGRQKEVKDEEGGMMVEGFEGGRGTRQTSGRAGCSETN